MTKAYDIVTGYFQEYLCVFNYQSLKFVGATQHCKLTELKPGVQVR